MAWQFILTDLAGNVHGEIMNTDNRKVVLPHLRIPTTTFSMPLTNPWANTVMNTDTLLKCYRTDKWNNRVLAFHGPVVSAEENGEANVQSIQITAAGPYWRVGKRFIGKSRAGVSWGVGGAIDIGLIAHNILDSINGDDFTGISKGTRTASVNGTVGPYWLKNAAEAIAELEAGLNSFEIEIVPTEPTGVGGAGGWPQIGVMNIAPIVGQQRPDAIFEYGTTKANVASYTRKVDREGRANRAIISVQGWPETPFGGLDLITRQDTTSIAAAGLYEDVVDDNGITDNTLRTGVADYHVLIRKNPRQQITFRPAVGVTPAPFIHYGVGDTVRAMAYVNKKQRFDAQFRVWGMTFNIDKNGNEGLELDLVMP